MRNPFPAPTQFFQLGVTTLGIRCGPEAVSFRVIALLVHAPLELAAPVHGEVCANEWVYHYYSVNASDVGKHLQFNVSKTAGSMTVVTQHLSSPLKVVPPYASLSESLATATLPMCNIEYGRMYLGIRGEESSSGCAKCVSPLVLDVR
jgi:hypothetical protein